MATYCLAKSAKTFIKNLVSDVRTRWQDYLYDASLEYLYLPPKVVSCKFEYDGEVVDYRTFLTDDRIRYVVLEGDPGTGKTT